MQVLVLWKLQEAVSHRLSSRLRVKHLSPDDFLLHGENAEDEERVPRFHNYQHLRLHAMPFLSLQLQDGLCSAWARYHNLGFKLSHWVGDVVLMTFCFQHCMAPVNNKFTTCVSIIREFCKTNYNTFASFPSPRLPHRSVCTSLLSLSRKLSLADDWNHLQIKYGV